MSLSHLRGFFIDDLDGGGSHSGDIVGIGIRLEGGVARGHDNE